MVVGLGPTVIWVWWVGMEKTEAEVKNIGEVVVVVVNTRLGRRNKGREREKYYKFNFFS